MIPKWIIISYLALISSTIHKCEGGGGDDAQAPSPSIDGFTTDLIHRDSPDSPLYDPSSTDLRRHIDAVNRSLSRSEYFNATIFGGGKAAVSDLTISKEGVYLMRYSLGTPDEVQIAITDTGSGTTWTQCAPCHRCISQKLEIFNPRFSRTYKEVRCKTSDCDALGSSSTCDAREQKCLYLTRYGDGSSSDGTVAKDTFTFYAARKGVYKFKNIIFGCGHDNVLTSVRGSASGIVGLAGGRASLVRQMGYDKFAYCLIIPARRNAVSKIHFGSDAVVSGKGAVTTPLSLLHNHYFLTLKAITVGRHRIEYHSPFLVKGGNILIDSGGVLTQFPENFYNSFEAALVSQIDETPVRGMVVSKLCYENVFEMPRITVHFEGADVEWSVLNTFMKVSESLVCLMVMPMKSIPIYGNVAQVDFMIGFDLGKNTVSFKPTLCGLWGTS